MATATRAMAILAPHSASLALRVEKGAISLIFQAVLLVIYAGAPKGTQLGYPRDP